MNATEKLEALNRHPGVLGVALLHARDLQDEIHGEEQATVLGAYALYCTARLTTEARGPIRVRLGDRRAVLMMGSPDESRVVAVAYLTQSTVVKSLSRMARSVLGLRRTDRAPQTGRDLHG